MFSVNRPKVTDDFVCNDYRSDKVIEKLEEVFLCKCYLCERVIERQDSQVEHFVPHCGTDVLKFNWNNLFYACSFCNHVKSDSYNKIVDGKKIKEILNCTEKQHDVYNQINYKIASEWDTGSLKLTDLLLEFTPSTEYIDSEIVNNTIELLNKIYNKTDNHSTKSKDLRSRVHRVIHDFKKRLDGHFKNEQNCGNEIVDDIKGYLSRKSVFSAFKRQIIKDHYSNLEIYFD